MSKQDAFFSDFDARVDEFVAQVDPFAFVSQVENSAVISQCAKDVRHDVPLYLQNLALFRQCYHFVEIDFVTPIDIHGGLSIWGFVPSTFTGLLSTGKQQENSRKQDEKVWSYPTIEYHDNPDMLWEQKLHGLGEFFPQYVLFKQAALVSPAAA